MSKFVLDASALLALVNQEPGQDIVAEVLAQACVSALNASELVAKLTDQSLSEAEVQEVLAALNLQIVAFDERQGLMAGYLRSQTKHLGLSLGDRTCLALGLLQQCKVITADKAWAKLDLGIEIQVIR
ncbi:MAG: type II toxin-antitoxin system VapC family toxin [Cyanobacteria bacterium P01_H01_bin.153]